MSVCTYHTTQNRIIAMCSGECSQCLAMYPEEIDWDMHELFKLEANSTVDRKERRQYLRCSYCRPNRKENANRKPVHRPKAKKGRRA